jgi:hypothetical protein
LGLINFVPSETWARFGVPFLCGAEKFRGKVHQAGDCESAGSFGGARLRRNVNRLILLQG